MRAHPTNLTLITGETSGGPHRPIVVLGHSRTLEVSSSNIFTDIFGKLKWPQVVSESCFDQNHPFSCQTLT